MRAAGGPDRSFEQWREAMRVVDLGGGLPPAAPVLRQLCDVDFAVAFAVDRSEPRLRLRGEVAGGPPTLLEELERYYNDGQPATMFSVDRPQRQQRNRLLRLGRTDALFELSARQYGRLGFTRDRYRTWMDGLARMLGWYRAIGLVQHHQLRILICDGPAFIGYLNAFHGEPLEARHHQAFRRLVPVFARRLRDEQRLGVARRDAGLLGAALAALPTAAFLVSPAGVVLEANALGQWTLDRDRSLLPRLAAAARGAAAGARVTPLHERGLMTRMLVEVPAGDFKRELADAAPRWRLTPREHETAGAIVAGASYRVASVSLGISERTVEHHVARALAKAGVASVSQLITSLGRDQRSP